MLFTGIWSMYSCESSISNATFGFLAVPVVDRTGTVLAIKIRTDSASPEKRYRQSRTRSKAEKRKLLKDQLLLVQLKTAYFQKNNILCCIKIDFDMADLLTKDTEIMDLARSKSFLRLEISEDFPNLSDGKNNRLLKTLSDNYKLWLGDLGAGQASLKALHDNLYDAVKVNESFFKFYSNSIIWPIIIKNLMRYCKCIIIIGKENYDQSLNVQNDISAIQLSGCKIIPFADIDKLDNKLDLNAL